MPQVREADFLALKNHVKALEAMLMQLQSDYPKLISIESMAIDLNQKPATVKKYITRNSSSLGIGTIFKDDEFKVVNGTMMGRKSVFLKLKDKYHG